MIANGPIPEGFVIDHLCKVRICVNPNHLRLITVDDNARQGGRFWGKRTHCKSGHEFVPKNTRVEKYKKNGRRRVCRLCVARNARAYRARLKGE